MTNKRRNKGPEHIREILKSAKQEWRKSIEDSVRNSPRFNELEKVCPPCVQIQFLYIEGDPQYIRMFHLN